MGVKIDKLDLRRPQEADANAYARVIEPLNWRGVATCEEVWGDWQWRDETAPLRIGQITFPTVHTSWAKVVGFGLTGAGVYTHALTPQQVRSHFYGKPHRSLSWSWKREHWWTRFLRWVTGIKAPVHVVMFEGEGDALDYLHHRKEEHAA